MLNGAAAVAAIAVLTRELAAARLPYRQLRAGEAEAVVFDSPNLMYYAAHEGAGKVVLVGDIFERQDYGVVFRRLILNRSSGSFKAVNRDISLIRQEIPPPSIAPNVPMYLKYFS